VQALPNVCQMMAKYVQFVVDTYSIRETEKEIA
jgi:hypothetical protein